MHPQCERHLGAMTAGRTNTLTFRIEPGLKEALRTASDREDRPIANMIEVMSRDYRERWGITIHEQRALRLDAGNPQSPNDTNKI